MQIKDRIKRIEKYFKEMQIVSAEGQSIIYVIVNFPSNWVIDNEIESKYDVNVALGNEPNEYYFATSVDNGEDKVFDAIEYNIEKMKEAIERAQLLSKKTLELKNLFEDETIPIEQLRNVQILCNSSGVAKISNEPTIILPKSTGKKNKGNTEQHQPNDEEKMPSTKEDKKEA